MASPVFKRTSATSLRVFACLVEDRTMTLVELASPWDALVGDRILGTSLIVTDRPHAISVVQADGIDYSPEAVYGAAGGVEITCGMSKLRYGANRKLSVIREG